MKTPRACPVKRCGYGLLRQYFPKNTDFKKVEQIEVRQALRRLNSRPRKDLDFKTPAQLMDDHRAALAA